MAVAQATYKPENRKKTLEALRAQLETERSSFMSHWRDLSDFFLPRRARFTVTDVNRGDRRNQKIIDSTATQSARTLSSGLMSGVTSPARPWFRLTVQDKVAAELASVKEWLDKVTDLIRTTHSRSNLYQILPTAYKDLGTFAIGCMFVEEDFDRVVRFYSMPVGSYMIANDDKGQVRVFIRDFRMTTRQLIKKFGYPNGATNIDWSVFSSQVKAAFDQGEYETWFDVCHIVMPNEDYDPKKLESKYKQFVSFYYERSQSQGAPNQMYDDERYLRVSGFDFFPVLCPRWEVTGEDSYGTECPGMLVLGDVKQLQLMQKRKAQAIEKMVNPPMVAPTTLKNSKSSIVAGDITYVDSRNDQSGFRPAHEVSPRVNELVMDIQDIREMIRKGMFEDLFLMLANSDRRQITAREVEERHEEKLLALGPVLQQLDNDLLDPLIDITFQLLLARGDIPEPPQEIQGAHLKVEYISVMAQAQKLIGVGTVERFLGFAGQMAGIAPTSLDKIDTDQAMDIYGDMLSVPNGLIRTDDQVAELRAQRAQQQQQMQQAAMVQHAATTAKELSQADMGSNNALTQLAGAVPGGQ